MTPLDAFIEWVGKVCDVDPSRITAIDWKEEGGRSSLSCLIRPDTETIVIELRTNGEGGWSSSGSADA